MKKILKLMPTDIGVALTLWTAAMIGFVIVGCATTIPNPNAGQPGQPATIKVADTNAINAASSAASTVAGGVATLYPPAALINPLIPIGTTIAFAISTALAAYKNQQNKSILNAVVQGVESAAPNDQSTVTLAAVKQNIKDSASAAGIQPALHAIVQSNA